MTTSTSQRLKVGILFGGRSAEHEISIRSARNIVAALNPLLYEPVPIAISRDGRWLLHSAQRLLQSKDDARLLDHAEGEELSALACSNTVNTAPNSPAAWNAVFSRQRKGTAQVVDVVFPVLHGPMGEDGTVQGMLELAGVPYVGAGVLGSAVGMDKDVMKRLLRDAGIQVAPFQTIRDHEYRRDAVDVMRSIDALGYPLFVKPANLGSSVGIAKVGSRSQLAGALDAAFAYDTKVLAEAMIAGREIECAVLGSDYPVASVAGEIVVTHPDGFYSYDAKYIDANGAALQVPAQLDAATARRVQHLAVATFKVLECHGLARVDFFLRADGELFVNEINTLPGFTDSSMFPGLWAASGVALPELLTRLIESAFDRHARRRALRSVRSVRSG
jgi:D-alanine-D-alanine ligase